LPASVVRRRSGGRGFVGEMPCLPRLPDLKEQGQGYQRDQAAGHVHQPRAVEVGREELHQAKLPPQTKSAGQMATVARQPAMTQTSQTGTIKEKNGSCRPAMALRSSSERPVTLDSVTIGVPRAPNATGDVFARRASPAAWRGRKPAPIMRAAEIATGV